MFVIPKMECNEALQDRNIVSKKRGSKKDYSVQRAQRINDALIFGIPLRPASVEASLTGNSNGQCLINVILW